MYTEGEKQLRDMANRVGDKMSERASDFNQSVLVLYTTVSSALTLFAFNVTFEIYELKILLLTSLAISLLIMFITLVYKYYFMNAPLQTFKNMDKNAFLDGKVVVSGPNAFTGFVLEWFPKIVLILILCQLFVSFMLVYTKLI